MQTQLSQKQINKTILKRKTVYPLSLAHLLQGCLSMSWAMSEWHEHAYSAYSQGQFLCHQGCSRWSPCSDRGCMSASPGAIGIPATSGILHHPQVVHRSPTKGEAKGKYIMKPSLLQFYVFLSSVELPSSTAHGKEPTCQFRSRKRCKFSPWFGKIPWRRKWQLTAVFLPGKSHGQGSLAGYSPSQRIGQD